MIARISASEQPGAGPGRDGNGPGLDRVIDDGMDVDEQVPSWQPGGLCETRGFSYHVSAAEAI